MNGLAMQNRAHRINETALTIFWYSSLLCLIRASIIFYMYPEILIDENGGIRLTVSPDEVYGTYETHPIGRRLDDVLFFIIASAMAVLSDEFPMELQITQNTEKHLANQFSEAVQLSRYRSKLVNRLFAEHRYYVNFIHRYQNELTDLYCDLLKRAEFKKQNGTKFPLLMPYHNQKTFLVETPLSKINPQDLLILDGYAFQTDELIEQALQDAENFYRNPHAESNENRDYSRTAKNILRRDTRLGPYAKAIDTTLSKQAQFISIKTVDAVLQYLQALAQNGLSGSVDAQIIFIKHLDALPEKEQLALTNYIIKLKRTQGGTQNLKFEHAIGGTQRFQCIEVTQEFGWQFVIDFRPSELNNIPASVKAILHREGYIIEAKAIKANQDEEKKFDSASILKLVASMQTEEKASPPTRPQNINTPSTSANTISLNEGTSVITTANIDLRNPNNLSAAEERIRENFPIRIGFFTIRHGTIRQATEHLQALRR